MGRKSNAKKIIREVIKEKEQKTKNKKVKASKIVETPTPKPSKPSVDLKKLLKKHKKSLKITFAIILAIFLVGFAYTLLQRVFRPADIAKFLPEDAVVGFVTINTDSQHDQHLKAVNLIKDKPYSKDNLIKMLEAKTSYNFQTDIQPWLGRQAGLALLKDPNNALQTYIFAEFRSLESAEQFQQKFPDQSFIVDDYLVFGPENPLKTQIQKPQKSLFANDHYRQTVDHLPFNHSAFAYINFQNVSEDLLKKIPFLNTATLSYNEIKPILNTLHSEGLTLRALDENFALQSYLALGDETIDQAVSLKSRQNYDGDLLELLHQNTIALWAGENLENRLRVLLEILTGGNQNNTALFDKLIEQYTRKYFGPDINFNQDILPLLRKEFAFAIEEIDGQKSYKFLLEVSFSDKDGQRLHQIANSFASMGAVFEPQIVEHTLPDGTIAKEIVAIPEKIIKEESTYKNLTIHELKMGSQGWGIYYALVDGIAIFSDSKPSLQASLDLITNDKNSLINTTAYHTNIKPVINDADELTYLNFAKIPNIAPLSGLLKSFAGGNAYFEGGIMSINYFDL
ncbi:DUF3352 domain-containing protein [Candidatus Gracilibacteria bacterium]|nr:DUF3352 domain-containing protein [Candidatus Gracilibacteria bacterium]